MIQEVYDHRLLHFLQKEIRKLPIQDRFQFRSTENCGTKIARLPQIGEGAFILTNDEDARIFGVATCKNAWYCPTCAAKLMSKYAADIGCLIDALAEKKQAACMITFTVPHTPLTECDEVFDLLFDTWKSFVVRGKKNGNAKYYLNRNDKLNRKMVVSDKKMKDIYADFRDYFDCDHYVRVGETTYGKNGWHPHFHALFFVDENKLQELAEWEPKLRKRWIELTKKTYKKIYEKLYPDTPAENFEKRWEHMQSYLKESPETSGLFISKDKDGKIIRQLSSNYICGWGADQELTGKPKNKTAKDGHYTTHELLETAAQEFNTTKGRIFLQEYFKFMFQIKKHRRPRIKYSNGTKKIISQWKQTQQYREFLKKKHSEDKRNPWRLLCWFTSKQWSRICEINETQPLIHNILFLASRGDKELISYFLELYDIKNIQAEHPQQKLIEDLYNDVLSDEYTSQAQEENAA